MAVCQLRSLREQVGWLRWWLSGRQFVIALVGFEIQLVLAIFRIEFQPMRLDNLDARLGVVLEDMDAVVERVTVTLTHQQKKP